MNADEATRLVFGLAIQRERADYASSVELLRGQGPLGQDDALALAEVAVRALQSLAELAATQKGIAPVDILRRGALLAAG